MGGTGEWKELERPKGGARERVFPTSRGHGLNSGENFRRHQHEARGGGAGGIAVLARLRRVPSASRRNGVDRRQQRKQRRRAPALRRSRGASKPAQRTGRVQDSVGKSREGDLVLTQN